MLLVRYLVTVSLPLAILFVAQPIFVEPNPSTFEYKVYDDFQWLYLHICTSPPLPSPPLPSPPAVQLRQRDLEVEEMVEELQARGRELEKQNSSLRNKV